MNKNKIIIYVSCLIIIFMITIPSVLKTIDKHNERLEEVAVRKIIDAAKDCYYNDSCVGSTIMLSELYEKMDLEEVTNPRTKKMYDLSSYVDVKNGFVFVEK